jgi:hypothetical protein
MVDMLGLARHVIDTRGLGLEPIHAGLLFDSLRS